MPVQACPEGEVLVEQNLQSATYPPIRNAGCWRCPAGPSVEHASLPNCDGCSKALEGKAHQARGTASRGRSKVARPQAFNPGDL